MRTTRIWPILATRWELVEFKKQFSKGHKAGAVNDTDVADLCSKAGIVHRIAEVLAEARLTTDDGEGQELESTLAKYCECKSKANPEGFDLRNMRVAATLVSRFGRAGRIQSSNAGPFLSVLFVCSILATS